MTEDYQQKCSHLSINLNNINRNLHLIGVDFFNALNGLKTLSGHKFIEHVIDTDDTNPEKPEENAVQNIDSNFVEDHTNKVKSIL